MATRLYLRSTPSEFAPTAGDKAAALPVGTVTAVASVNESASLKTTLGATASSASFSTTGTTAQQSAYVSRFTSNALTAQTIAAGAWNLALVWNESNANANMFMALSIYVWRPSTSTVVGYVYDNATPLGAEFATSAATVAATVAGAAVAAADGDVLVCEAWAVGTQSMASRYTVNLTFGGPTEAGAAGSSADGSWIEAPGTLTFKPIVTNPVRYIRDYMSGSSGNASSYWVEIQAYDADGNNVALGAAVTASAGASFQNITRITDGDTASANYAICNNLDPNVTIDLGAVYNIAKVTRWHYYTDARVCFGTKTEISVDGVNWVAIFDSAVSGTYTETASGKTDPTIAVPVVVVSFDAFRPMLLLFA